MPLPSARRIHHSDRLSRPFRHWVPPLWAWAGWATPAMAALPLLTVERQDGRLHHGRPGDVTHEVLTLVIADGAGTAELPFAADEIRRLSWGDESSVVAARRAEAAGDPAAAAAWSELWGRRARLLPWADPLAWEIGRAHLRALEQQERHPEAAVLARRLAVIAPDVLARRELADAELLAVHALGLRREAASLAERWIAAEGRPVRSALGWRIRAEVALAEDEPATARDTALAAIALATLPHPPHLAACEQLAITALESLGDQDHADLIRNDSTIPASTVLP